MGARECAARDRRGPAGSNFELRARILQVVSRCLDDVPLEKLTISMICERARISRPTFYRQFSDRYDVFNWLLRTTMTSSLAQVGVVFSWRDALERFCHAMEANRDLSAKYLAERGAFSSYQRFIEYLASALVKSAALRFGDEDAVPARLRFQATAFSRAFVAAFADWLGEEGGHGLAQGEFVDCALSIVPRELFDLLDCDSDGLPFDESRLRATDRAPLIEFVAEEFPTAF